MAKKASGKKKTKKAAPKKTQKKVNKAKSTKANDSLSVLRYAVVGRIDLSEMHMISCLNYWIQKIDNPVTTLRGQETLNVLKYEGLGPVPCYKLGEHPDEGVSPVVNPAQTR